MAFSVCAFVVCAVFHMLREGNNDDGERNENATKRLNKQKQSLCACVMNFGTFVWPRP